MIEQLWCGGPGVEIHLAARHAKELCNSNLEYRTVEKPDKHEILHGVDSGSDGFANSRRQQSHLVSGVICCKLPSSDAGAEVIRKNLTSNREESLFIIKVQDVIAYCSGTWSRCLSTHDKSITIKYFGSYKGS
jgi:hypothetical protein